MLVKTMEISSAYGRLKIYEEVRSPWHMIIKTVSYVTVHVVRLRLAALGIAKLFNTVHDRDKFMEKVKINSNVHIFFLN